MIQSICCVNCKECSLFDISLTFIHRVRNCGKCHHIATDDWQYCFCNLTCMAEWFKRNQIHKKGFPCMGCMGGPKGEPTGFDGGYKQNGTCRICNGSKRVKTRVTTDGYPSFKPLES